MSLKIRKVLVPTDFSSCAHAALAQGVAMAEQLGAELHLLHVMLSHDEDPYSLVYQVAEREEIYRQQEELCTDKMKELAAAEAGGLQVHRHLRRAFSVAPAILEVTGEQGIDFLVLGGHGRRGLRRFLLGSVAEEVVRLAPCPVLTVREQGEPVAFDRLGRVLVPVDFSEHSRVALRAAKDLATRDTVLELVHVVEIPVYPHYYDVLHDPSQEYAFPQVAVKVEDGIARFAQAAGGPEVASQVKVLEGPAAASITEYAERVGADLIVIATHGLSGLKHLLLGSVTEKVVRSAKCPVLTLKGVRSAGGDDADEARGGE